MNIITPDRGTFIYEYSSMSDFLDFLNNTPNNSKWRDEKSQEKGHSAFSWTGTSSYEEALELLQNGWSPAAERLTSRLNATTVPQARSINRPTYAPVGYAPSVPRYLNNIPDAMVSSRRTTQKIPTITITKRIAWSASFSAERIFEEGFKLLRYIRSLEDSGTRVRLIVAWGGRRGDEQGLCRITIKEPGERLNLAKIAFPLIHPSMVRRLCFAWLEKAPQPTSTWSGYGSPSAVDDLQADFFPKETYIPEIVPEQYCC